jgi:predicted lactoylglutathione lyase
MKLVLIRLSATTAPLLEKAIESFNEEGLHVEMEETLKYENIWEFSFKDPDENFMFNLGHRYGKLYEQGIKETV